MCIIKIGLKSILRDWNLFINCACAWTPDQVQYKRAAAKKKSSKGGFCFSSCCCFKVNLECMCNFFGQGQQQHDLPAPSLYKSAEYAKRSCCWLAGWLQFFCSGGFKAFFSKSCIWKPKRHTTKNSHQFASASLWRRLLSTERSALSNKLKLKRVFPWEYK